MSTPVLCLACAWQGRTDHTCPGCGGMDLVVPVAAQSAPTKPVASMTRTPGSLVASATPVQPANTPPARGR